MPPSECREFTPHARDKRLALGLGHMVHVVQLQPAHAAAPGIQRAQALHEQAASGVADELEPPPGRARGGDADEQADVAQLAADGALLGRGDAKAHARQPHAFEPALQHGRCAVEPGRVHDDPAFGPAQGLDVRGHAVDVALRLGQVGRLFGTAEDRVEAVRVKVDLTQLMAGAAKRIRSRAPQRGAEAVRVGVAEDQQQPHARTLTRRRRSRHGG